MMCVCVVGGSHTSSVNLKGGAPVLLQPMSTEGFTACTAVKRSAAFEPLVWRRKYKE